MWTYYSLCHVTTIIRDSLKRLCETLQGTWGIPSTSLGTQNRKEQEKRVMDQGRCLYSNLIMYKYFYTQVVNICCEYLV